MLMPKRKKIDVHQCMRCGGDWRYCECFVNEEQRPTCIHTEGA